MTETASTRLGKDKLILLGGGIGLLILAAIAAVINSHFDGILDFGLPLAIVWEDKILVRVGGMPIVLSIAGGYLIYRFTQLIELVAETDRLHELIQREQASNEEERKQHHEQMSALNETVRIAITNITQVAKSLGRKSP